MFRTGALVKKQNRIANSVDHDETSLWVILSGSKLLAKLSFWCAGLNGLKIFYDFYCGLLKSNLVTVITCQNLDCVIYHFFSYTNNDRGYMAGVTY